MVIGLTLIGGLLFALLGLTGCEDNDLGRCCAYPSNHDGGSLPKPQPDGGSTVSEDPALNCQDLSCVSYQGSQPYCTRPCTPNSSCPSGFVCQQVLHASVGADASVDSYFCVNPSLLTCKQ